MDYEPNRLQLIIMEAVHVHWKDLTLNKQFKHAELTTLFTQFKSATVFIKYFVTWTQRLFEGSAYLKITIFPKVTTRKINSKTETC